MDLPEFHEVIRAVLGWDGDLGYIIRIHGQEFNSFRRKARSKMLRDLKLHRQEKFLYICDTLNMWEWDVRVIDIEDGVEGDEFPLCLGGRGAAPPEHCGGPTGYRLMLKRQSVLAQSCLDAPRKSWEVLRNILGEASGVLIKGGRSSGPCSQLDSA